MEALLNNAADQIIASLPEEGRARMTQPLNVVYFPRIGYLVVIHHNPNTQAPDYEGEIYSDDGELVSKWEFQWRTDDATYFKSSEVRALDDVLGDIVGMICGIECSVFCFNKADNNRS